MSLSEKGHATAQPKKETPMRCFGHSFLYNKSKPVVPAQWVHIDYMKSKRDMHFNRIIEACESHGITQLLSFWYNWNQEVITELYGTLFFDKREREREFSCG
jgi:hypothetical protein